MRIILNFDTPPDGGNRQWTVTIDDGTNPPTNAPLTRTQAKRIAGELDEMIADNSHHPINLAQHVGNTHMQISAHR